MVGCWVTGLLFQWIGLRENFQENPIFNGNIYGVRFRFSLTPIHGLLCFPLSIGVSVHYSNFISIPI